MHTCVVKTKPLSTNGWLAVFVHVGKKEKTEKKTLEWWWWKEEKKTQFPTFEIEIVPGIVYLEAEAALACLPSFDRVALTAKMYRIFWAGCLRFFPQKSFISLSATQLG